jgi:hypothetical protein
MTITLTLKLTEKLMEHKGQMVPSLELQWDKEALRAILETPKEQWTMAHGAARKIITFLPRLLLTQEAVLKEQDWTCADGIERFFRQD